MKFRKALWEAARQIVEIGSAASAQAAKDLGIEETDSFKTFVKKTHEAQLGGAMPARSALCKYLEAEGLKKKPASAKSANRKTKKSSDGRSGDSALIKRARTILRESDNLKQFCEGAGIPPASAYKWRSGDVPLSENSANRIIAAAEGSSSSKASRSSSNRVVGASKTRSRSTAALSRSEASDIDADLDLISRAKGISKHDTMLDIVRSHMAQPAVRKAIEIIRRNLEVQSEMQEALAAL
jgi:hypothetical protein